MSIWNTLYTGSSGIRAFGDGLQVVGDNIANVSTFGFKGARAQFESMLGGSAVNGQREGNGVRMTGPEVLFHGGNIVQSEKSLDLAIDGLGFFATRNPATNMTTYTRDGHFGVDGDGYLTGAGGRVQAFAVDPSGQIAPGADDLIIEPLAPATATTTIDMEVQLDAQAAIINGGTIDPNDPTTYNHSTQLRVFDSTGASHEVTFYFANTGTGAWNWSATVDGGEINGTPGTPQEIGTGTLAFDTSGRLDSQSGGLQVDFVNAAPGQTIAVDFGEPLADGLDGSGSTSHSLPSDTTSIGQDGEPAGSLDDVRVQEDGTIVAQYTNGRESVVGAVALAEFEVQDGLERTSDQSFIATVESGEPIIGQANSGSRGRILGGAREQSNVDLSNELVTLIAYQRAFQSNARTVSTADEVLQELTNLKR